MLYVQVWGLWRITRIHRVRWLNISIKRRLSWKQNTKTDVGITYSYCILIFWFIWATFMKLEIISFCGAQRLKHTTKNSHRKFKTSLTSIWNIISIKKNRRNSLMRKILAKAWSWNFSVAAFLKDSGLVWSTLSWSGKSMCLGIYMWRDYRDPSLSSCPVLTP